MVKILIVVALFLIVGGVAVLGTLDIPSPEAVREKVIPNDRYR